MWLTDSKEQKEIDDVKEHRPICKELIHTFIEYWGENKKRCVDCGYEEKIIIKE
jgi:Zn ribbon nucleic-acid-binding protein